MSVTCDFETSIEDLSDFENIASIFPNPTSSKTFIQFKTKQVNHLLEIYSTTGQKIKMFNIKNNFSELDSSDFQAGIYILIIKENNRSSAVKKVIVY
jgi:hypothetical protein